MASGVTRRACALLVVLAACAPEPDTVSGLPLAGLSDAWHARFTDGAALFNHTFTEADGLGPLYIRASCANCHQRAARGPGVVTRLRDVTDAGLPYGDVVRGLTVGGAAPVLSPDSPDVVSSFRAGLPVMGLGWLDAIAESELLRVEAEQSRRTDGISGRVNRGHGAVGRFGLKARAATLDDFVADALVTDLGLTSALRPVELPNPDGLTDDAKPGDDVTAEQLRLLADFMRLVRVPVRASVGGAEVFERVRCGVCHVPSLATRADYPVPQLAGARAEVFSDLLLHDLGPALADGLSEGDATGAEWRTAPLIGVRFSKTLLHDGRALSVDDAVRLHAGEATASVEAYRALSDVERNALLAFVSSL